MKKIIGGLICLFLITGCGKVPKLANGQELVVKLDNSQITADELYTKLKDTYATNMIVEMIDNMILSKEYPTDKDMTTAIDKMISNYKTQYGDQYTAFLEYNGITSEDDFKNILTLSYRRSKAVDSYVKSIITDKEIKNYYDNTTIGDIKASHILIKSEATSTMTDDEKATKENEALAKAKSIIDKLNNGEDFAKLAKEYSSDTKTANDGGNLGYFNRGFLEESFEKASIDLKVGSYTKEPVKTTYGYHIILKTDQKAKASLETVRTDIIEAIKTDKTNNDSTLQYKALIELRKKHKLEINDDKIKSEYNKLMDKLLTSKAA